MSSPLYSNFTNVPSFQRIIEVCGRPVENMENQEVVDFIRQKSNENALSLLVIHFSDYDWYKSQRTSNPDPEDAAGSPRAIHVKGFRLAPLVYASTINRGPFRLQRLEEDSNQAARDAGLLEGDYLIEVCGKNVEQMEYAELVSLINEKQLDDDLHILVVDRDTLSYLSSNNRPIGSDLVMDVSASDADSITDRDG